MEQNRGRRKAGRHLSKASGALALLVAAPAAVTGEDSPVPHEDAPRLGALEVRISGFESDAGRLAIALFASEQDFETQTNAVHKAWLGIEQGESHWRLTNLPDGEYALIAYHDQNGNEQIDLRALGMPKEPVGVSNDARGLFGPPRFRAAKFSVAAPLTRHEIVLR